MNINNLKKMLSIMSYLGIPIEIITMSICIACSGSLAVIEGLCLICFKYASGQSPMSDGQNIKVLNRVEFKSRIDDITKLAEFHRTFQRRNTKMMSN